MPPMTYIADKLNYDYQGNFFQHYTVFFTHFTDLTGADGGFSVGQFWFILYLFLISLIAVGIILLQRKIMHSKDIDMSFVLVFLVGYYIFSDDVINKVEKWKWIFLCIGITATVFNIYFFIWSDMQQTLPNMIAKYVSEWFMINSLLGIGKRYLNFNGKVSKYIFILFGWHCSNIFCLMFVVVI